MLSNKLGPHIALLRRNKNISQEQLAEGADYSVEFISMVERGVNFPSLLGLERISKALDTPLKDLFDFDALVADQTNPADSPLTKRKRGRPRIHPIEKTPSQKRPRGRPRKPKG